MRNRRHRSLHEDEDDELNITAFMNLMVILVPFLLITAVFSQVAILNLKLPQKTEQGSADNANKEKPWQLEVVIHPGSFDVNYSGTTFPVKRSEPDDGLTELSSLLKKIKLKNLDKTEVSILSEFSVDYDTLIQVMDTVRVLETVEAASLVQKELFPDISIGDAPLKVSITGEGK